jgi:hypothetical protein
MRIEPITDEELTALEAEGEVAPVQFRFADTIREMNPQSADLITDAQDDFDFRERERQQDELGSFILDFDNSADEDVKGWIGEMQNINSDKDWKTYIQTNAVIGHYMGSDGIDDPITRNLRRDVIAKEHFNGVGVGDDAAFHAVVTKHFTKRKDTRDLDAMIVQQSAESGLGEVLQQPATDWKTFREQIKTHVGYDPKQEAKYYDRWAQVSQNQKEQAAVAMEFVTPALQAMEEIKNSGQSVFNVEAAADALLRTPKEQQDLALALLVKKAGEAGDKKEKGGHMMQLFTRALANQMLVGPSTTMEAEALLKAEKTLNELQPGQEYGGRFGSLEDFAKGRSATSSEGRIFGAIFEPLMKNNVVTEEGLQQARDNIKAQQERLILSKKLQQIASGSFDPLKSNGGWIAEKVAYPFVESALPSLASMVLTKKATGSAFGAAFTMWGSMASDNATQLLEQNPDMSFGQAYKIAKHAAVYQSGVEYATNLLSLGSIKLLGNTLLTAQAPLWKTGLKAGALAFASENAEEAVQELIPGIVQDLTATAPDTPWDKVLDGYWTRRADTFFALLPIIVMAGGGAAMQAKATRPELERIAEMTSRESLLKASGITDEWRERIVSEPDVVNRLNLFQQAMQHTDKATAEAGIVEIEQAAEAQKALVEKAQQLGMQPFFRVNTDQSITVVDSLTNDEIATVQNGAEATKIAMDRMGLQENNHAQAVADLGAELMTMQAQATTGAETGRAVNFEYRPFQKRTAKDQIAANPESAKRVFDQLGVVEGMEHGADLKNSFINGFSQTTFENDIYTTTNTLFATSDVLKTFHEDAHGMRRKAMADGRFTRDEQITAFRAIDAALAKQGGKNAPRLYLANAATDSDVTETMLDEAIAEIMESEVLRVGKLGGKANQSANTQAYSAASKAIDTAYAGSGVAAKAISKLRGMMRYLRAKYGEVFNRAVATRKAIASGDLNESDYHAFLDKLAGREDVTTANEQAVITAREIIDGVEVVTFEDGTEMDLPFSIGIDGNATMPAVPDLPTVKVSVVKAGYKINGEIYNIQNPAPQELALAAAIQLANKEKEIAARAGVFGSVLNNTKNQSAFDLAWVKEYQQALRQQGQQNKSAKTTQAQQLQNHVEQLFGIKTSEIIDEIKLTINSYYKQKRGNPTLDQLVYRGETSPPKITNISDSNMGDTSNISQSKYPLIRITLTNGGEFYEKIRISDHGQVSANAPRTYDYDYRAKSLKEALQKTSIMEDMQAAADALWLEQKNALPDTANGAPYTPIQDRDGSLTGRESRQSLGEKDANSAQDVNDISFSTSRIQHADQLTALQKLADSLAKDPERQRAVMERAALNLSKLRRDTSRNVRAFGKDTQTKVLGEERARQNIQREANMRQAIRREELELESLDRYQGMIEQPELAKLQNQPIHSVLSDPKSPLKGRIRSRGATAKMQGDMLEKVNLADYDGADGLNKTIFGGSMAPDQMAQELFDMGLIRDGSIGTMWDAIRKEQDSIAGMKELMQKAKADFRQAKVTARDEAKAWQTAELKKQKLDHSLHAKIIRAFGMLDGILYALPPEVRGKVGIHTATLAKLKSDEKRLEYLSKALENAAEAMERHLKKQYDRDLKKILERSKPAKDEVGKQRVGKAGAEVHALFDVLRDAVKWNETEVNGKLADIESELNDNNNPPSAEREAWLIQLSELVQQVGNWRNADAARREAAVKNAERVLNNGLAEFQSKKIAQRERRDTSREALAKDTGKAGTQPARMNRMAKDNGVKGKLSDMGIELLSFEQISFAAFGESSAEGAKIVNLMRNAEDAKFDQTQARLDRFSAFLEKLAGGKFKAEKLAYDMEQKTADVKGISFSQSELITFALMWRQEDGRRHMKGEVDENGNSIGQWHYNETHAEAAEKAMTPEAVAVLDFLIEEYAGEYEPLNAVYRDLRGVNLPSNPNYSPLTVKPQQAQQGQMQDPVTGQAMNGAAYSPGSLRTRSQSAVAEPDFRSALSTYAAHVKQIEHWKAFAPAMAEARAILGKRDLMNRVEEKAGARISGALTKWLDRFENGGSRDAAASLAISKGMQGFMGRAASMALIGRASVLMIQATQLAASLAQMPTGSFVKRFGMLFTGNLGWGKALQSDYIQRRLVQMPPAVQAAMSGLAGRKPRMIKHAVRAIGQLISGTDALMTAGTFAIVYDYELTQARKMQIADPEAHALRRAELVTDRLAQPMKMSARSLMEIDTANPYMRLVWAFASDARQKMALMGFSAAHFKNNPARFFRAAALVWGVNGVFAALLRTAWRDAKDDEDEEIFDEKNWNLKRLALSSALGPFGGVPLLGDGLEAGVYKLAGEYLPQGNMITGIAESVAAFGDIGDIPNQDISETLRDVESMFTFLGGVSETAAAATSIMHIVRDFWGVAENLAPDDE